MKKYMGEKIETEDVIITEWFGRRKIFTHNKEPKVADIFLEEFCASFFSHKELKKFKDIHKNRRCFIIGNGSSLCSNDLDKIYENGEFSFEMNRIYKIYEKTAWRPSYYLIDDFNAYKNGYLQWISMDNGNMFVREYYNLAGLPDMKNANRYHSTFQNLTDRKPDFLEDITKTVYWGATVAYSAMQIAAYMGAEVHLLGMVNYKDQKKEVICTYKIILPVWIGVCAL